jgi:hypothetical protein
LIRLVRGGGQGISKMRLGVVQGIVVATAMCGVVSARAGDPPLPEALAKVAKDLCFRPELYGYTRSANGEVNGRLEVPLLAKRLIDLGVSAQVKAGAAGWKNVPQNQLAASISDYRHCATQALSILVQAYTQRTAASVIAPRRQLRPHRKRLGPQSAQRRNPSTVIYDCSVKGGVINGTHVATCAGEIHKN